MDISQFDFELPESLIAVEPLKDRASSKLVHLNDNGTISDRKFIDIVDLVKPNDVLVFNNTKVIKARVKGNINLKAVEITLIKKLSGGAANLWQVLAKPGKKFSKGGILHIEGGISAEVIDKNEDGLITLKFNCGDNELFQKLDEHGSMPLPPYIEKKRKADKSDDERYQTVFASKQGAVAAPTAGLHFTKDIIDRLVENKVKVAEVTLHVGAGTFLPVRVDDIKKHKMHSEYYEISDESAKLINETKKNGGRVIAVGTTSLRAIESASDNKGMIKPACEETSIFIYPGYKFKIVDCLITNFHLPKSTLFMLISAFSGLENVKKMYMHAIQQEYRFFSYGDSCFLERSDFVKS